ncbi:hypothetical protein ACU4GD_30990 [Cupriavidus basilensis]
MIDARQALEWIPGIARGAERGTAALPAYAQHAGGAANPPHAVRLAKRLLREGMHRGWTRCWRCRRPSRSCRTRPRTIGKRSPPLSETFPVASRDKHGASQRVMP